MSVHKKHYDLSDIIIVLIMVWVIVITLYPFLNVVAKSFNDPLDTVKGGITIYPRKPTLDNYHDLFLAGSNLPAAFRMSILRTVVGTICGVVCNSLFAFALSRKDFVLRRHFSLMLVVTMYVGGGLIPTYLLIRNLGMLNTFQVYIIPGLIGVFYVIIIRSYMDGIPISLQESAKMDGANDLYIFFRIVFPLCMPVIATVALFLAVGQWNSWFDTYLYNRSNTWLTTLQYELMKIQDSAQSAVSADTHSEALKTTRRTPEALKMAITVVVTAPILVVYPFLQKYFVHGITLGAIKE
jgi:putative aldouronate transport system permease protein